MERRGFFGALVGAFAGVAAWLSRPASAKVPRRWHTLPFPVQYRELGQTTLPIVDGFDPRTDKILLVMGATIPRPVPLGPEGPVLRTSPTPPDKDTSWIDIIPNMADCPPQTYPRAAPFRITPEVQIGTVDELVAGFRADLERAVAASYMLQEPGPDPTPWQSRGELQAVQPVFAKMLSEPIPHGYVKDGVIRVKVHPAITHGSKQIAEFDRRRAEMDRLQEAPENKITS